MRVRAILLVATLASGVAGAQIPPRVLPGSPILGPWVTVSCVLEPRWFETLRNGPMDFCKKSLRYRRGHFDCLTFTDQVCWTVNQITGEWQQFRTANLESLIACPDGPEPPTCPRLR